MKRRQLNTNRVFYRVKSNDKDYYISSSFIYKIGDTVSFIRNKQRLKGVVIVVLGYTVKL